MSVSANAESEAPLDYQERPALAAHRTLIEGSAARCTVPDEPLFVFRRSLRLRPGAGDVQGEQAFEDVVSWVFSRS